MSALPTVELDPPTISMTFGVNDSPLAGRDGTHVSGVWCLSYFYIHFLPSVACVKSFGYSSQSPSSQHTPTLCCLCIKAVFSSFCIKSYDMFVLVGYFIEYRLMMNFL